MTDFKTQVGGNFALPSEKDLFTPKNVTDARPPEQNPGYSFCSSISPTLSWEEDILGVTINAVVRALDESIQKSVIDRYALDFTELRQFLEHKRAQKSDSLLTQAELFFKRYPNAKKDQYGLPQIDPCAIGIIKEASEECERMESCQECHSRCWRAFAFHNGTGKLEVR